MFFCAFVDALGMCFEASCPLGSPVAPSGSQNGGVWSPSGSDLVPMGSQSGSMGTPRDNYVGHLAPQVVALGYPRSQIWLQGHGDKTCSLEGKNNEIDDSCTFFICFSGFCGVRGESCHRLGSDGLRPFGFAREEELIS